MSERLRATYTTFYGDQYRLRIYDEDFGDSVETLYLGVDDENLVRLSYTPIEETRPHTYLAAKISTNIEVRNSTIEDFIDDLIAEPEEERFYLVWEKYNTGTSSFDIKFFGWILTDNLYKEDLNYPYKFELVAIDGISRLKNINYDNDGSLYSGLATYIEHFIKILTKVGLNDVFATNDDYLMTAVNWYEDSQFSASPGYSLDPLDKTSVYHENYHKYNEETEVTEALSTYDVLMDMLLRWNAMLVQARGRWNIIQLNEREQSTTHTRYYKKDNTRASASENEDFKNSTYDTRQGGYEFFPALLKTKVKYEYKQSEFPFNLLPPNNIDLGVSYNLGALPGGGSEFLEVSGDISETYDFTSATQNAWFHSVFKLKLVVGSKYLTNKNGYYEWSNTITDRVTIVSPLYKFVQGADPQTKVLPVSFVTPEIPASGDGEMQIDFEEYRDQFGNNFTMVPNVLVSRELLNWYVYLMYNQEDSEGEIEFVAINTTDGTTEVRSSKIGDLENILTGDGPESDSLGRLLIYDNASSSWQNANKQWTVGGSGTGIDINKLLVQQVLYGQMQTREKYTGKIYGGENTDIDVLDQIVMLEDATYFYYILLEGTYNENERIMEGTWFKIEVEDDTTKIKLEDDDYHKGDPPVQRVISRGFMSKQIQEIETAHYKNTRDYGITKTSATISSGNQTSISIDDIGETVLRKGDKITLLDVVNDTTHELEVNADQTSGDTSLTFTSYSFSSDIPPGAVLILNNIQQKIQQLSPSVINWPVKNAVQTADYTIENGVTVVICNPPNANQDIHLPDYGTHRNRIIAIVNASDTYTVNIKRNDIGDKINGSASDYTLSVDSSILIVDTAIGSVGWATIFKSSRK